MSRRRLTDPKRRILLLLSTNPGLTCPEICNSLKMQDGQVRPLLDELRASGFLIFSVDSRTQKKVKRWLPYDLPTAEFGFTKPISKIAVNQTFFNQPIISNLSDFKG